MGVIGKRIRGKVEFVLVTQSKESHLTINWARFKLILMPSKVNRTYWPRHPRDLQKYLILSYCVSQHRASSSQSISWGIYPVAQVIWRNVLSTLVQHHRAETQQNQRKENKYHQTFVSFETRLRQEDIDWFCGIASSDTSNRINIFLTRFSMIYSRLSLGDDPQCTRWT
jgi:hypothetical protein